MKFFAPADFDERLLASEIYFQFKNFNIENNYLFVSVYLCQNLLFSPNQVVPYVS